MSNTNVIKTCPLRSNRRLCYLATAVRVTSMWGSGQLIYATNDGWVGVRLDGECGVYEYPAAHINRVDAEAQ